MVGYWKLRKAALIDAISRHESAIVDEATKDVIDDVKKVSVASVPATETRILVPKPSGLWSAIGSLYIKTKSVISTLAKPFVSRATLGKIYDKTKSVINTAARMIERLIPEISRKIVRKEF